MSSQVLPEDAGAVTAIQDKIMLAEHRNKYKDFLYKLGIAEIILGCIAVLLCVISLVYTATLPYNFIHRFTYLSTGIWCGIFPIISGSFGVCAKKNPSLCIYVTTMTMSIVSASMMPTLITFSCVAALSPITILVVLHILIAVAGFATLIVSVVHSAYCCAGACCVPIPSQVAPPHAQHFQQANDQYMLFQNPTTVSQPSSTSPGMQFSNQPPAYNPADYSSQVQFSTQSTYEFNKVAGS